MTKGNREVKAPSTVRMYAWSSNACLVSDLNLIRTARGTELYDHQVSKVCGKVLGLGASKRPRLARRSEGAVGGQANARSGFPWSETHELGGEAWDRAARHRELAGCKYLLGNNVEAVGISARIAACVGDLAA